MNKELLKKTIDNLNKYEESLIKDEINGYCKEYIESRWYREPTLKEVVGVPICSDMEEFKSALNSGYCDLNEYMNRFEETAREYGSSWFDEDLNCERSGCEEETEIYIALRNLVADVLGLACVDWKDYYEARGV